MLLLDSVAELLRSCAAESERGRCGEEYFSFAEQLFASARLLKGAGSLTVIAAAPAEGEPFDRFAEAANCLLFGSREWAAAGETPGIDFTRSFTRRSESLLREGERAAAARLRECIARGGAAGLWDSFKKENL